MVGHLLGGDLEDWFFMDSSELLSFGLLLEHACDALQQESTFSPLLQGKRKGKTLFFVFACGCIKGLRSSHRLYKD